MSDPRYNAEDDLTRKIVHLVIGTERDRNGITHGGTPIVDVKLVLRAIATAGAALAHIDPADWADLVRRQALFENTFFDRIADQEGRAKKAPPLRRAA